MLIVEMSEADCDAVCYLSENSDEGENKNGSCKGQCLNVGHPAPIWTCRGTLLLLVLVNQCADGLNTGKTIS